MKTEKLCVFPALWNFGWNFRASLMEKIRCFFFKKCFIRICAPNWVNFNFWASRQSTIQFFTQKKNWKKFFFEKNGFLFMKMLIIFYRVSSEKNIHILYAQYLCVISNFTNNSFFNFFFVIWFCGTYFMTTYDFFLRGIFT